MKTNIGVFFGGRSTEHEISVISANQAINAIDSSKYDVTPVYITKEGRWFTGAPLLDLKTIVTSHPCLSNVMKYICARYSGTTIYIIPIPKACSKTKGWIAGWM